MEPALPWPPHNYIAEELLLPSSRALSLAQVPLANVTMLWFWPRPSVTRRPIRAGLETRLTNRNTVLEATHAHSRFSGQSASEVRWKLHFREDVLWGEMLEMQAIMMFENLFFRCFPAVKGMANRSFCFQVNHWLLTINTATSLVDTEFQRSARRAEERTFSNVNCNHSH